MRIRSRIGSREPPPVLAGAGIGTDASSAASAALLSSARVVVTTTVTGWPAVYAEAAGCDGGFQAKLQRVVAALGGAAAVACLGVFVRLVTARPHCCLDGFEVRAGLRVEQAGQPRHAVGSLPAEVQPAATGPVLIAEQAVGIEVVGDALSQFGDDSRIDFGRVLDQGAFRGGRVGGGDTAGQQVDGSAYRADVVVADRAGLNGFAPASATPVAAAGRSATGAGRIRTASLNRRVISLGVMRSRCHNIDRICAMDPVSSGGSAISAKMRYIRPRLARSWVSNRAAASTRNLLPTKIRRRIAHHVVGGVDRIESGSDPFPCFVGADRWTHISNATNQPDNPVLSSMTQSPTCGSNRNCG